MFKLINGHQRRFWTLFKSTKEVLKTCAYWRPSKCFVRQREMSLVSMQYLQGFTPRRCWWFFQTALTSANFSAKQEHGRHNVRLPAKLYSIKFQRLKGAFGKCQGRNSHTEIMVLLSSQDPRVWDDPSHSQSAGANHHEINMKSTWNQHWDSPLFQSFSPRSTQDSQGLVHASSSMAHHHRQNPGRLRYLGKISSATGDSPPVSPERGLSTTQLFSCALNLNLGWLQISENGVNISKNGSLGFCVFLFCTFYASLSDIICKSQPPTWLSCNFWSALGDGETGSEPDFLSESKLSYLVGGFNPSEKY